MAEIEDILSSEEEKEEEETLLSSCGDDADDEDDLLAQFLESEVLAVDSDQEDMTLRPSKRLCVEEDTKNSPEITFGEDCFHCASDGNHLHKESGIITKLRPNSKNRIEVRGGSQAPKAQPTIENGFFSNIPVELFQKILKFLSSEDLVTCALVCRFLNSVASDESLWRRL
ncbi:hypothetical protein KI387_015842, partial [Taxus chinensis]